MSVLLALLHCFGVCCTLIRQRFAAAPTPRYIGLIEKSSSVTAAQDAAADIERRLARAQAALNAADGIVRVRRMPQVL